MKISLLKAQGKFILIALIVLYTLILDVNAFSNNTLYNGTSYNTIETLTFTGPQNITRNLSVPQNVILTNAYMNLSGYYGSTILNGLVSYWTFDEPSGTNIKESISGVYNFTAYGTAARVTGVVGNALNCSSAMNQYAKVFNYTGENQTGNMTFSFWYRPNNIATYTFVLWKGDGLHAGYSFTSQSATTSSLQFPDTPASNTLTNTTSLLHQGSWSFITVTLESRTVGTSVLKYYVNGTMVNANYSASIMAFTQKNNLTLCERDILGSPLYSDGAIDELGIWNRTLSDAEISNLYNSGVAIPYTSSTSNPLSLNIGNNQLVQTVSANGTGPFIQSIITSNLASYINSYLTSCVYAGSYCQVPIDFSTNNAGSIQYSNLNFNDTGFLENSQTFSSTTTSGNYENFKLNFTISAPSLSSVSLYYNNTLYPAQLTNNNNNFIANTSITIPSVAVVTNKTFYWVVITTSTSYNSSSNNQTINSLGIDNCSTYTTKILNLTLYEQETRTLINGTDLNGTIRVLVNIYPTNQYPNSAYIVGTFSQNYFNTNNALVCINLANLNNSQYYLDATIQFSANSFKNQYYNIQKYFLTNTTTLQNISLLDLNSSLSQDFIIQYKDNNFVPVSGALVQIQRQYVGSGIFQTTEIPLTDQYGQTTGHFNLNGVIYSINIIKNGVILASFNPISVACQDIYTGQCQLSLNAQNQVGAFSNYYCLNNICYQVTFNQLTRTYNIVFSTVDGTASTILFNAFKLDQTGNISVCNTTLTSSAGNINCVVASGYGNITLISYLYSGNMLINRQIDSIITNAVSNYGDQDVYVMTFILMMTLPLMFIPSAIGLLIGLILGLIIAIMLGLYNGGTIMGIGSAVTWLIVTLGIIIFKLSKRRHE